MFHGQPVLLISGDGGSGKDVAAACFASHGPFKYVCSTSYVAAIKMWHLQQMPREYESLAAMYHDRANHREWWAAWIDKYNQASLGQRGDGAALYLDALEMGNTLLTGIRKKWELHCLLRINVVDLIVWIDRPGIDRDPTQEYGPERADMIIRNDKKEVNFQHKCQSLAKCFFPVEKAAA